MTDNSKLGAALAHTINSASTVHWTSFELGGVLKAILAEFVVIPRSELQPLSWDEEDQVLRPTVGYLGPSKFEFPDYHHWAARVELSRALYLEEKAAAEAKRNARRDEVAHWLIESADKAVPIPWVSLQPSTQKAIDRIIELEEAAA